MELLTIGQVAEAVGLKTSAMRYYESIGLIAEPDRVSGQRRYTPDVIERLHMITTAKEAGLSLDDIRLLLDGPSRDTPPAERWAMVAEQKLPEVNALIKRATALKHLLEAATDCTCVEIDQCFAGGC